MDREVYLPTDTHGPFEPGERPGQLALAKGQQPQPPRSHHQTAGMPRGFGNQPSLLSQGAPFSERAQISMAPRELGTGSHRRQIDLTAVLVALCSLEGGHRLPEGGDGLTIRSLRQVGIAEVLVRQRLEEGLAAGPRARVLPRSYGLVIGPHTAQIVGEKGRNATQLRRVVEGYREGLGLVQIGQHTPEVARGQERCARREPQIDGLPTRLALLRQVWEGPERLLEGARSL